MTFKLQAKITCIGIHEHLRTIRGRKDGLGNAILDQVSLGWFVHTDLDDGGISFCVGPECPTDIAVGDTMILTLEKS